jgi:hypothetical protein
VANKSKKITYNKLTYKSTKDNKENANQNKTEEEIAEDKEMHSDNEKEGNLEDAEKQPEEDKEALVEA